MSATRYPSVLIAVALSSCTVDQTGNMCQKLHD